MSAAHRLVPAALAAIVLALPADAAPRAGVPAHVKPHHPGKPHHPVKPVGPRFGIQPPSYLLPYPVQAPAAAAPETRTIILPAEVLTRAATPAPEEPVRPCSWRRQGHGKRATWVKTCW